MWRKGKRRARNEDTGDLLISLVITRFLDAWDLWNLPILGNFGPCEDKHETPVDPCLYDQGA